MTGNNGAQQCSPNDPGTQKWPFFYVQTPKFFIYLHGAHDIACKWQFHWRENKFWGLDKKERSFLNHWVIRRTLVCFVVSGHDINIEFWYIQCAWQPIFGRFATIIHVFQHYLFHKLKSNFWRHCFADYDFLAMYFWIQSNSIIVEKMVASKFSTILEFSTIMDFCVVQGNELSSADRVYCVNCEFLFTAWAAE